MNHLTVLLWPFTRLPSNYVVVDLETTGLPDEKGDPGIVSIGVVEVANNMILTSSEMKVRPRREITKEAEAAHGISNRAAQEHPYLSEHWDELCVKLRWEVIIMHNALFDWPILCSNAVHYGLPMPTVEGVFCSQKSAIPWAVASKLPVSTRGPSLDLLVDTLGIKNLRKEAGRHGAEIDAILTHHVVEELRWTGAYE